MSDPLPPRLVLDQELLARLGPQSSRAEWERTLKRTGLATVEPGQTRAGKLLSAIQRGVQFLCERQLPNGDWPQQGMTGVFNRTCMLNYRFYRNHFPLWALALAAKNGFSLG
ncbi:MAG TPA: hypothetical protein PKW90_02940 [Myxococcota bacterium]|nr:hypothetical protein [Myxococcota bacterium]